MHGARRHVGKGGAPHATMRFMPLADIFVGAIACLLILIIVARQTREQVTQIPQADYAYDCGIGPQERALGASARSSWQPAATPRLSLRRVFPPSKTGSPTVAIADIEQELSKLRQPGHLSVRVLLFDEGSGASECANLVRAIVKKLNKHYETPGTPSRPRSYLLLDIAPPEPSAMATSTGSNGG